MTPKETALNVERVLVALAQAETEDGLATILSVDEKTRILNAAMAAAHDTPRLRLGLRFVECDTCRAKTGSPLLCGGCLHNRSVIGSFNQASLKCEPRIDGSEPRTKTWHRALKLLNTPITR